MPTREQIIAEVRQLFASAKDGVEALISMIETSVEKGVPLPRIVANNMLRWVAEALGEEWLRCPDGDGWLCMSELLDQMQKDGAAEESRRRLAELGGPESIVIMNNAGSIVLPVDLARSDIAVSGRITGRRSKVVYFGGGECAVVETDV